MHGRNAQESIEIALGDTPVVLLQGARQVGKTTLVQALSADVKPPRRVLTLDDGAVLSAAQRDPAPSCGKRIKFITEQRKPDAVLNFLVNL